MWKSLSVTTKIWLSLSILIIGYFASMTFGFVKGKQTQSRLGIVSNDVFPASRYSQLALSTFNEQVKIYNLAIMIGDEALIESALQKAQDTEKSIQAIVALKGLSSVKRKEAQETLVCLKSFTDSAQKVYLQMIKDPYEVKNDVLSQLSVQKKNLLNILDISTHAFADKLKKELSAIGSATRYQQYLNMILFFAVVIVSLILVFIIITKFISHPLKHAVTSITEIAKGDLSICFNTDINDEIGRLEKTLDTMVRGLGEREEVARAIAGGDLSRDVVLASEKDTLGKAILSMINSLNNMVGELFSVAAQVDSRARQVSESSQSLSQGATEQASSIQQMTSTMVQIGSQTKTNAENATQANQLSISAQNAGLEGSQQMEDMTKAMVSINDSSKEISRIIKAIDDIAFQTNLLALNAAVEAARAGAHGKGFAVVAQEVRALASRSAIAALETSELIENAIKKVDAGNEITIKTRQALTKINDNVSKVADIVGEITTASHEQAQRISEINQGLEQIDTVTQHNTTNADETSKAARELSSQASQVRHLLRRFKLKRRDEEMTTKGKNKVDDIQVPDIKHKTPDPQQPLILGHENSIFQLGEHTLL